MNAAPVTATAFALASVIVSTEATPVPTGFGANAFVIVGCASTFNVAEAAAAVPAFVVDAVPVLLR